MKMKNESKYISKSDSMLWFSSQLSVQLVSLEILRVYVDVALNR